MEALEALLKNEKKVLTQRPTDNFEELLPYRKHDDYLAVIVSRGRMMLLEGTNLLPIIDREKKIYQKSVERLEQNVKAVEMEYGAAVTPEDIETYLFQLAGRVLDYAKEKLGGIVMETLNVPEVLRERFPSKAPSGEEYLNTLVEAIGNPFRYTLLTLGHVQRFYNRAMKS